MSGEVPKAARVPFAKLAPADVLFFGAGGPRSRPAQVNHTGVYLGNGWMIHSSGEGVYLSQLEGWYRHRFAWARRPLAEAGLN
jgi:cell wall-associated NlpC family hydrolase